MDTTKVAVADGTDFKETSLSNTLKTLELQATHTHTHTRALARTCSLQRNPWNSRKAAGIKLIERHQKTSAGDAKHE